MKVIHVKNSLIAKIIGVEAITLYPFIFYSMKYPTKQLMNHEMVHVDQVRKLGWWKFYTSYLEEYFELRSSGLSKDEAYMAISYEKEAYERQKVDRINYS